MLRVFKPEMMKAWINVVTIKLREWRVGGEIEGTYIEQLSIYLFNPLHLTVPD